jgi:hypothetical protein
MKDTDKTDERDKRELPAAPLAYLITIGNWPFGRQNGQGS